ncbi:unnamed protein product [Clonostachys rosea]|uniref:AMP-activated protein kinase glycogen-binding domain-containing protein n=1 Tax=Bionectria ochroleuca TaxID=29856 RepID=A0ABY6TTT2_BIOOC|nr:unnamed protein product [Clonostachys rosea]
MASSGSQHTITFKQAKTVPPLFLAGSFAESNWKPQEMTASQDEDGEYTFTKTVNVIPGQEYQYNIKSGEQGPWVYDKSQAFETLTNSLFGVTVVPKASPSKLEKDYSAGLPLRQAESIAGARSSTPARIVAETAAEVADTAEQLDKDSERATPDYTWAKEEPLRMPLFAHESFGAYEFLADDALDHDQVDDAPSPHRLRKESKDYSVEEVDINDPTIESFPSDRSSVMDALRKIQSSNDSQPKSIETSSPIAIEHGDDFALTGGSLSPKSPGTSDRREGRLSHSSYGNKRSTASLTSIAEEDSKPIKTSNSGSRSGKPRTTRPSFGEVFNFSQTPPSDDDKGMMMKQKKKPGLAVDSDGLLS